MTLLCHVFPFIWHRITGTLIVNTYNETLWWITIKYLKGRGFQNHRYRTCTKITLVATKSPKLLKLLRECYKCHERICDGPVFALCELPKSNFSFCFCRYSAIGDGGSGVGIVWDRLICVFFTNKSHYYFKYTSLYSVVGSSHSIKSRRVLIVFLLTQRMHSSHFGFLYKFVYA